MATIKERATKRLSNLRKGYPIATGNGTKVLPKPPATGGRRFPSPFSRQVDEAASGINKRRKMLDEVE